jgi:enoyl-CoA hydratase/carnithine racemase
MNIPLEPTRPAPNNSPVMPITTRTIHRVQLQEEKYVTRLSISSPLDVAAHVELAHTLDAWSAPTSLKVFVLDLTTCTSSTNSASTEEIRGKGLLEGRQGRARERALAVAQEHVLAALRRISAPILGIAAGTVPPPAYTLLSYCDLLLAAEDACFVREAGTGLAYREAPIHPGRTGSLSERISAYQAYRQGFVNWLAPAGQLTTEAERILAALLDKSAPALVLAKRAFLIGLAHPKEPDKALDQIGALYLRELMNTADAMEGLHAFLEKRPPKWEDR